MVMRTIWMKVFMFLLKEDRLTCCAYTYTCTDKLDIMSAPLRVLQVPTGCHQDRESAEAGWSISIKCVSGICPGT